jgi:hypothetical protein
MIATSQTNAIRFVRNAAADNSARRSVRGKRFAPER